MSTTLKEAREAWTASEAPVTLEEYLASEIDRIDGEFKAVQSDLAAADLHIQEADEEIARLRRLEAWLIQFEKDTAAIPVGHEIPERGCSTYNWHIRIAREARKALNG